MTAAYQKENEQEEERTENTDEINAVEVNEAQKNQSSATPPPPSPSPPPKLTKEKFKKAVIILNDIRINPLYEKYLDRTHEPVKQVDLESVVKSTDLSPIEIPDSDDEGEHICENVIEISSDSDSD